MPKSDEYREMQISSGQLAAVILSLLALCVLIFYLGIRVGTQRATDEAAEAVLRTSETASAPVKTIPAAPRPAAPSVSAADIAAAVAETKTKPAETKTKPAESAAAKAKPGPKTETKPSAAETKTAPAKTKTAGAPSGTYYIQAGAIDNRSGAESLAQKIEGLGFRAIVLNPLAADKKPLYRVRVGPYETKSDAQSALARLAAAMKKKTTDFLIKTG